VHCIQAIKNINMFREADIIVKGYGWWVHLLALLLVSCFHSFFNFYFFNIFSYISAIVIYVLGGVIQVMDEIDF
jgi:hypothetical protein